jgi:hypothetical protein
MYSPIQILSKNIKCGCSLNMPIAGHCRPTKNCSHCCYARTGHTALQCSKNKQNYLSKYLAGKDISRLITEARGHTSVRLSGTGDLNTPHIKNILKLAKAVPNTMFWGMTRKLEIANSLNNKLPNLKIMVSVDASSPKSVWNYKGVLCWGPRLASDLVPKNDPRIKTIFPYHSSGHIVNEKAMPKDPRDCPVVRHTKSGCLECGRCWNW